MPQLTIGEVALRHDGLQQRESAAHYNIAYGEVSKILKRKDVMGVSAPRARPGPPVNITRRQYGLFVRLCTDGRYKPTCTLRIERRRAIMTPVPRTLMNGRIIWAGFHDWQPLRKSRVKQGHRQRRLQLARGQLHLESQHLNHVMYSDGTSVRCTAMLAVSEFLGVFRKSITKILACHRCWELVVASHCWVPLMRVDKLNFSLQKAAWTSRSTGVSCIKQCSHPERDV